MRDGKRFWRAASGRNCPRRRRARWKAWFVRSRRNFLQFAISAGFSAKQNVPENVHERVDDGGREQRSGFHPGVPVKKPRDGSQKYVLPVRKWRVKTWDRPNISDASA